MADFQIASHLTPLKINEFKNSLVPTKEMFIIGKKGKPIGFWYAYGNEWKDLYVKLNPKCDKVWNYEFQIPNDTFVQLISKNTIKKNKILQLNKSNIFYFFKKYHKNKYIPTQLNLFSSLLYKRQADANNLIDILLKELIEFNGTEMTIECEDEDEEQENQLYIVFKGVKNILCDIDNDPDLEYLDYLDEDDINFFIDLVKDYYNYSKMQVQKTKQYLLKEKDPNRQQELLVLMNKFQELVNDLEEDFILYYWKEFWEGVSKDFIGVEFNPNIFNYTFLEINNELTLNISWLKYVEIKSGCLFKPKTFFTITNQNPNEKEIHCKNAINGSSEGGFNSKLYANHPTHVGGGFNSKLYANHPTHVGGGSNINNIANLTRKKQKRRQRKSMKKGK